MKNKNVKKYIIVCLWEGVESYYVDSDWSFGYDPDKAVKFNSESDTKIAIQEIGNKYVHLRSNLFSRVEYPKVSIFYKIKYILTKMFDIL
jgi:hypothetical protein